MKTSLLHILIFPFFPISITAQCFSETDLREKIESINIRCEQELKDVRGKYKTELIETLDSTESFPRDIPLPRANQDQSKIDALLGR